MHLIWILSSAVVGVVIHLSVFIRGEWHLKASAVAGYHILAILVVPAFYSWATQGDINSGYITGTLLSLQYLLSLFGSIIIYRLFFHRLRHFPGPRLAAVTKLWHVVQNRNSKNHVVLDRLHKKYGDFVRSGPEELTIFHASAQDILDGPQNQNTRSDWYDIVHPRVSPIFSRTNEDHRDRRAIWNHALSNRATKGYIPDIVVQIHSLMDAIDRLGSTSILINEMMQMYAYESMGHFAFDQEFDQLKTMKMHKAAAQQRKALTLLGPFNAVPWAITIALRWFPNSWKVKDWNRMVDFCDLNIRLRLKSSSKHPDVSAWLVREYNESNATPEKKMNLLSGNAVALMIGASDTSASTFTALVYHLAKFPQCADLIYKELINVDINDSDVLASQPYLNGFINESMRLLPAALTFGTRQTPAEGIYVDRTFIPGGVKINTSRYTVSRFEHIYANALDFVPDRWFAKPEMIKDKMAFAPFGTGRRQCVGKGLALSQTRLLLANLVSRYHVEFEAGTNVDAIELAMQDQLTAQLGDFRCSFRRRLDEPSTV